MDKSINQEFEPEIKEISDETKTAARKFQAEYKVPDLTGVHDILLGENFPKKIHAIRSMVGDDETITSNSLAYCVLCIIVGPIISRIKVSWEDAQVNQDLFNYAEGWILLPPSMDSSFEAVTKYARGDGVPFVLDPVRFRNLSAVRKQSDMENDLPSKFRNLAESAAWTNPSWFTWDLHQLALLIGIEIFDFMRSNIFPYMFHWEGGCGGAPPWNNLLTASAAIFRYKKGRASKGILGVMTDANLLHGGEISPGDALFTKNLNIALSGDTRWLTIRSELENRRNAAEELGLEYEPNLNTNAEEIPAVLMSESEVIHPKDALTGVVVSFLREKSYLTTEMDLVSRLQDRKRLDAIWGSIPLREIENQIDVRKKEVKESYLETLSILAKVSTPNSKTSRILADIEDSFSAASLNQMARYYRMRVEQATYFTSFIYNEQVRIFKTSNVEEYFSRGTSSLRDGFCESIQSLYRPDFRRTIELPDDKKNFDQIETWLLSDSLKNLFSQPIPPGIGPDDARITREAYLNLQGMFRQGIEGVLILIISSDRKMCSACQQVLANAFPDKVIRVNSLPIRDYVSWCLSEQVYRPGAFTRDRWILEEKIYNPIVKDKVPVHGPLRDALQREMDFFFNCRSKKFRVYYDYPNINRTLKRFKIDEKTQLLHEYSGGFLSRSYVENDPIFARRELESIHQVTDFDYLKKKVVGKISKRPAGVYSAKLGDYVSRSWVRGDSVLPEPGYPIRASPAKFARQQTGAYRSLASTCSDGSCR
jgi:hypothetical protein